MNIRSYIIVMLVCAGFVFSISSEKPAQESFIITKKTHAGSPKKLKREIAQELAGLLEDMTNLFEELVSLQKNSMQAIKQIIDRDTASSFATASAHELEQYRVKTIQLQDLIQEFAQEIKVKKKSLTTSFSTKK